jgi:hypothetical protein
MWESLSKYTLYGFRVEAFEIINIDQNKFKDE